MIRKFENIESVDSHGLYNEITKYQETLIEEATANGSLAEPGADNEYTREIGRVGVMLADYESIHQTFKHVKFKSPLVVSIENEMKKRQLKQRQTADLLDVKESTFSQIMTGKRSVSMRMAKRLYKELHIDPKLILEYS